CAAPLQATRPPSSPREERAGDVDRGWETFSGSGGVELFGQYWKPARPARGVVIVQHGLKDHGTRYAAFAARLVAEGYAVYAMDLRGHGRSSGRRVTIDSFDEYLDDFDIWVRRVKDREPGRPIFLFGHSMGGGDRRRMESLGRPLAPAGRWTSLRDARSPSATCRYRLEAAGVDDDLWGMVKYDRLGWRMRQRKRVGPDPGEELAVHRCPRFEPAAARQRVAAEVALVHHQVADAATAGELAHLAEIAGVVGAEEVLHPGFDLARVGVV